MQLPTHLYNQKVSLYLYRRGKDRRVSVLHKQHVAGHAGAVILEGVSFRVREGTRQAVLKSGRKTPHAFVDGVLMQVSEHQWGLESSEGVQVSYNPFRAGYFYNRETGEPIYEARVAVVTPKGVLAFV